MSEIKYIKKAVLTKLFSEYADKAPHLAKRTWSSRSTNKLSLRGFAFICSFTRQNWWCFSWDHITLLQRLNSQAIKGLPSTTIIQIDQSEILPYPMEINEKHLVIMIMATTGTEFSFCHNFSSCPIAFWIEKLSASKPLLLSQILYIVVMWNNSNKCT